VANIHVSTIHSAQRTIAKYTAVARIRPLYKLQTVQSMTETHSLQLQLEITDQYRYFLLTPSREKAYVFFVQRVQSNTETTNREISEQWLSASSRATKQR